MPQYRRCAHRLLLPAVTLIADMLTATIAGRYDSDSPFRLPWYRREVHIDCNDAVGRFKLHILS